MVAGASIDQINSVLIQIKNVITYNPDCFIVRTDIPKNEKTLLELHFLPKHVGVIICELTYKNYYEGPEDNKSKSGPRHGEMWMFGVAVDGREIYIKIHVVPTKKFTNCVCVSFHDPEYPIEYPYK